LLAGAAHDTSAREVPATAQTAVGAPGTVRGVTAELAADATDVPFALVAVTVKVYAVPFASPVTVAVVAPDVVAVAPPGDAVTVYPVTGDPPLLAGAAHDTLAWLLPGVPVTAVGAPGAVATAGVVRDVSSITNEVAADASSVSVNESVMVWPA
jgi:hypothetical protein